MSTMESLYNVHTIGTFEIVLYMEVSFNPDIQ